MKFALCALTEFVTAAKYTAKRNLEQFAGFKVLIMDSLRQATTAIREADALLITAGAGMGVDSGLPDFRGNEGFWKAYPVAARLGLSFMDLANPHWFAKDPALAWAFYGHRLNLYRRTIPHAGFATLLRWAERKPAGYFVFTSNVDGHFKELDSTRIASWNATAPSIICNASPIVPNPSGTPQPSR